MELIVTCDYDELSRRAADDVAQLVREKPDAAVVLATGDTPLGMYRELAARRVRGELDTSRLRVFQLDEYVGLPPGDERSLYGWMGRAFLGPLAIPPERVVRLEGDAADPEDACRRYVDSVRQAGGYDLAVLGLGPNGHLGYNEPPADAAAPTRIVALAPESIASGARYWGGPEQVPPRALTAGMDLLLAARRILLLVAGEHKRAILGETLDGPVVPEVPASYLRRADGVTVITDRAARPPRG